jgi:uncharacterized protein (TIGR01319 family)
MSQPQQNFESIMVVDCGTAMTKAVLLDIVEGQYRFVAFAQAPTTANAPWQDVSIGALNAIRQLEQDTGRVFVDAEGQLILTERADGRGVDCFLAVSSAAEPLRVVLAGLVHDVSLASARRAVLSTYARIEDTISLEQDTAQNEPRGVDAQINAIWHHAPQVLCVVGGTNGGASAPVLDMIQNVVRVALYLLGEDVPTVVYAGNAYLRQRVTERLGELAPLRVVDNVRPQVDVEDVGPAHEEIEVLFYDLQMQNIPGLNRLRAWSPTVILPTARAADYMIRYCERAWKSSKPVLGVDIGSSSVTINVCYRGQARTTVRTDLGMGDSLHGLLEHVEPRHIMRWLPFEVEPAQIRDRLLNKALNPQSIPQTREDLMLEQAAAREMLRLALRDSLPGWPGQADDSAFLATASPEATIPACEPIIASGGVLTQAPYQGHAALVLLDALQPVGISTLYLDTYNLIPALGTAANVQPLAAVQTLRNQGLTYMGTVVVPTGQARPGDRILTIRAVDKPSSISLDVAFGELEVVPPPLFETGTMLELTPTRGFDVGRGPGKSLKIKYRGGTVGLIVDARGRPLEFAADRTVQQQRMDHWLWEMMSA